MKKTRLISIVLAVASAVSLLVIPAPLSVSAAKAVFNAVEEPVPDGNVLTGTDFDTDNFSAFTPSKNMARIETETGGYMQLDRITVNYAGFTFKQPKRAVLPGIYKFTGYFRMMYDDEVTDLRVSVSEKTADLKGTNKVAEVYVSPTSDKWMKVEFYVELTNMFDSILINGGPDSRYVQPYCIDNISFVKVDAMPDGYTRPKQFGKFVGGGIAERSQVDSLILWDKWYADYEKQFEVQGVIVNQDADALMGGLGSTDEASLKQFALGYKDSHVTDFMICVNNTLVNFPSETWDSLPSKYLQKVENGVAVDYSKEANTKNAYEHFVRNGLDYIKTWCETFPTIGINPWISFRMNDIHGHGNKTDVLLSNFYHNNPQIRRKGDRSQLVDTYAAYAPDYMHELSRTHMLDLINESLSRYDCYGIELDWQREIYLFGFGDEYNGIEVLNDFMREVARIVEIYEQKYGHDIKIGIRCASDVETNYDFGLDVLTWAAEGMLDLVIPTAHYQTTDSTIPVVEWTSLMHPYGIEVAPCIEVNIKSTTGSTTKGHTLQTYNGMAAAFLSLGADKIALYNQYVTPAQRIKDIHKVSTTAEDVSGTFRHWNIVSTIGSLEKLMTLDRRMVLTHNDTYMFWRDCNAQLPLSVKAGETGVLRIPVGDIPADATVTLKFSTNNQNIAKRPAVYVNSKAATWQTLEINAEGYSNMQIITYTVPASAFNSDYFVVEITPQRDFNCDYAEVLIEVAK